MRLKKHPVSLYTYTASLDLRIHPGHVVLWMIDQPDGLKAIDSFVHEHQLVTFGQGIHPSEITQAISDAVKNIHLGYPITPYSVGMLLVNANIPVIRWETKDWTHGAVDTDWALTLNNKDLCKYYADLHFAWPTAGDAVPPTPWCRDADWPNAGFYLSDVPPLHFQNIVFPEPFVPQFFVPQF